MYQLYDRGHIKSLDDPLTDYCSQFSIKNPYDLENVVTLRFSVSINTHIPIHMYVLYSKANKNIQFHLRMLIKV